MQAGATRLFVPLLIIAIAAFMWLKKYSLHTILAFSPSLLRNARSLLHFLPRSAPDHRRPLRLYNAAQKISLVSYLNYTLNFTTLVSGPIQRYNRFASMQLAPERLPLDIVIAGEALERIIVGFFKVNVLSFLFLMIQTQLFRFNCRGHTRAHERIFTAITIAAVYPFYIYCNFSGYIDIVIGIARFLRMKLPENFNRPFSSENYLIFWSRWHITLSTWLQIYVYAPLMLASLRRWPSPSIEPFLNVFAYFVTFFLVGLWHGQTSMFICFGILLGLGMSLTKLFQVLMTRWLGSQTYLALNGNWFYNTAARGLTFTWSTFTMLWFWSNWTQLRFLATSLTSAEIALTWILIFLGSSVALAFWEEIRLWLLSFQFENQPALSSRYVRTVWSTALVVISIATIMLLKAPPPDIVYKTF